jgi:PAS domain S-box-containing protein
MRQRNVTRRVELRLLGGFEAAANGRPLVLRSRKDRALLAYLALSAGRRHSRERLALLLWSDVAGDPRHSLRQSLSVIARALGASRAARVLDLGREEIRLEPAALAVDAQEVRELLQRESAAELERASALYAGPLLEDLGRLAPAFDDWLTVERERLAAAMVDAQRRLLDLYAAAGTPQRAIPAASRLVAVDPYQEEARRELMLLYAECGHTQAAIAQYEAYAALLRKELGAEPDETTKEIHRLLLEGHAPARRTSRPPARSLPARTPAPARPGDGFLKASVVALEQMPDCVVVTDLDGRIVGWNQWARHSFGYEKREVFGRKPSFLYGPGADASLTAGLIEKAIRYGRWSGVLRLFNKDGSSRLHKRTMMPLRDESGRIVGVFGVTRPLTRPVPGL